MTDEPVMIEVERGDAGLLYATSPDLPGLLVAEPDLDSLRREVPRAILDLRAIQGDVGGEGFVSSDGRVSVSTSSGMAFDRIWLDILGIGSVSLTEDDAEALALGLWRLARRRRDAGHCADAQRARERGDG